MIEMIDGWMDKGNDRLLVRQIDGWIYGCLHPRAPTSSKLGRILFL